ncbi:hypothetical protein TNCV_2599171 [Trichonephila clavipes]|nr:hypothetical protein TNCV_2599171 [Trichonephila clavipes]
MTGLRGENDCDAERDRRERRNSGFTGEKPRFSVNVENFTLNGKVERTIDEYFYSPPESHFQEGILMLEKRWTKRVDVKGDHVENKILIENCSLSLSGR